ncbi:YcaO-like family protein [Actinoplanes sp. NPDC051859]|uniref:YcaO-like family protein n=1 Tax=Actinoplanes sp. NPDC051859 TaxID=3363909 RepID=UPI0037A65443
MQTIDATLAWAATDADRVKVRLPGTARAQAPAATLETARRAAGLVGITRVADITRLDVIGIPTYQAIRPLSRTLAVSQGKGVTPELAMLSAMLESIETWHVEQPLPATVTAPPRELDLPYDLTALPLTAPHLLHDRLPLDWLPARSLADGGETLVPRDSVRLSLERPTDWRAPAFLASSNGLASGNTVVEASLHGLYEVIERDAIAAATRGRGIRVDPHTLRSAIVDDLCTTIARAGVVLETRLLSSPTGLPCFLAWVACDDYPEAMYGFGCHLDAATALSRAITEATQTRLAYIAGARDDLRADVGGGAPRRPEPVDPMADAAALVGEQPDHDSLLADLAYVVRLATTAYGHAPLVADLSRAEIGVSVVKVLAPGSRVSLEVL